MIFPTGDVIFTVNTIVRGTDGVWMIEGPPSYQMSPEFQRDAEAKCTVMTFSKDGKYFAWNDGKCVRVISFPGGQSVLRLDKQRVSCLTFSPLATILATWEPYTVDRETKSGVPNLQLWDMATGELLKAFIQKKQTNWCPQWSEDEGICARNVNNELHFFENSNFSAIHTKLHLHKVSEYAIAPTASPYSVAAYVPGSKGQPSFVRLFRYPNFVGPNSALANKSFFKADRINITWNKIGKAVLILTSTESSDSSYYGEQGLHFMGTNGESCIVPLGKNGPIYHLEWNPDNTGFCVVYGYMPSKATLYDMKCNPVFDFGTGPRNYGYYNPQGTIMCLAGFGNLRGNMEFWDVQQQKLICQTASPDSTNFYWFPDGEYVITATTSPRLRVGNGYKVWHYTGILLEQVTFGENQLYEVAWQPVPEGTYPPKPLVYKASTAPGKNAPQQPAKAAYRPPGARGQPAAEKLHTYELPSNMKQQAAAAGPEIISKAALKNKKKRDAKKAKADQEAVTVPGAAFARPSSGFINVPTPVEVPTGILAENTPNDKAFRNATKKLQQIKKLKEQQQAGKQLEKNQLEKLATEEDLIKELQELEFS